MIDIQKYEDWYTVSVKQIFQQGGIGVLNHYGQSLMKGILLTIIDLIDRFSLKDHLPR
jgi:hypothetical protein